MITKGKIKQGEYFDSVTLMRVGKEISKLAGVIEASVVMGTNENKAILQASNLLVPEFKNASDTDLLICVQAETEKALNSAFKKVEEELENTRKKSDDGGDVFNPRSMESALKVLPKANIAMISVAGKYAGLEALKALEAGLHVMLFSDNISLETEIMLKKYAQKKGLLVMGPDCGTAIINGVPLAFANVVKRGNIGIVAASGTGLQELTCIISNEGAGISQALGTGGRDVKKDVGGIMFIEALKALAADNDTKVIILASKPPHESVIKKIAAEIKDIKKPIITVFLGANSVDIEKEGLHVAYIATTFEEAALCAIAASKKESLNAVKEKIATADVEIKKIAAKKAGKRKPEQRYLRGLFSGGTFCGEAQVIFKDLLADVYSNAPLGKSHKLTNSLKSEKNTVVDLGEDEFTAGRPHPMIDYSLRNKKIIEEANDPAVAVILLDVVLGYGSHKDPTSELVPVIRQACKKVAVVCSVTGTDGDPQNRSHVIKALAGAGAIVMPTNAAACKLAALIVMSYEL